MTEKKLFCYITGGTYVRSCFYCRSINRIISNGIINYHASKNIHIVCIRRVWTSLFPRFGVPFFFHILSGVLAFGIRSLLSCRHQKELDSSLELSSLPHPQASLTAPPSSRPLVSGEWSIHARGPRQSCGCLQPLLPSSFFFPSSVRSSSKK